MKRKIRPKTLLPLVLCQLAVAPCIDAATHNVSSLSDLNDLVGDLSSTIQPGDRVILADGTYSNTAGGILFRVDGTAADPIVIEAETVGGVTITGGSIVRFTRDCSHLVLRGFVFQGNASVELDQRSHHLRITQNTFAQAIPTSQDKDYLIVRADDVEIDHNLFDYKDSGGAMLDLTENNTSGQVVQNVWVHHNHFRDNVVNTDPNQNDVDTLTVGRSSTEHSSGNNTIEYNLFERCDGGAEIISSKSSDNTYRYNTFKDCEGDLTTRHSHRCLIYGNYFINTEGMRIWGDDHRIDSNYFENGSGIRIGRGQGSNRNKPENVQIIFNTFKNCTPHYYQMVGSGNEAPDNITFSNNIIDDDGNNAVIGAVWGTYTNGVWQGNMFNGVTNYGPVPTWGYTVDNPELQLVGGAYHLSSTSPAINAAAGTYNAVTTDIDGQNRPSAAANKDIGADEFTSGSVLNPILTPADVGPYAGGASGVVWTGAGNGTSLFQEANWEDTSTGSAPAAGTINGNTPLNGGAPEDYTLSNANLADVWNVLNLGNPATTFTMNNSLIRLTNSGHGFQNGIMNLNTGSSIDGLYVLNMTMSIDGTSSLTLHGGGIPINTSTVNLAPGAVINLTSETVAAVNSEHLGKIFIDGTALSSLTQGVEYTLVGDGASGSIITASVSGVVWTGAGDGTSLFQEANWEDTSTGSAPAAGTINGNTPLNGGAPEDYTLSNANLADVWNVLNLGNPATTFTMNNSLIRLTNSGHGFQNGIMNLNTGSSIDGLYVLNMTMSIDGTSSLTLHGGGTPINGTTVNLAPGAVINLTSETVAAVNSEHLGKIFIGGTALSSLTQGVEYTLVGDGASGSIITATN